jgi:hypothetical protein
MQDKNQKKLTTYKLFSRSSFFLFTETALNAWKFGGFVYAVRVIYEGAMARLFAPQAGTVFLMGFRFTYADRESLVHTLIEQFGNNEYFFAPTRPNPVIVDAGANIGDSLLYFAYRYPSASVYCFEPNAEAFSLLEKNIKNNQSELKNKRTEMKKNILERINSRINEAEEQKSWKRVMGIIATEQNFLKEWEFPLWFKNLTAMAQVTTKAQV